MRVLALYFALNILRWLFLFVLMLCACYARELKKPHNLLKIVMAKVRRGVNFLAEEVERLVVEVVAIKIAAMT